MLIINLANPQGLQISFTVFEPCSFHDAKIEKFIKKEGTQYFGCLLP